MSPDDPMATALRDLERAARRLTEPPPSRADRVELQFLRDRLPGLHGVLARMDALRGTLPPHWTKAPPVVEPKKAEPESPTQGSLL